jgi:hypothetical protein
MLKVSALVEPAQIAGSTSVLGLLVVQAQAKWRYTARAGGSSRLMQVSGTLEQSSSRVPALCSQHCFHHPLAGQQQALPEHKVGFESRCRLYAILLGVFSVNCSLLESTLGRHEQQRNNSYHKQHTLSKQWISQQ